ncbi:hypothetical protein EVJ58_g2303 [Rhodofomes roseus]|nr:hypothetical protein EVJ58_g2303 [Rhodofomes roseus]
MTGAPVDRHRAGSDAHSPRHDGPSFPPPPRAPPPAPAQGGLDTFDSTTFDPTSPASWTALGNAWNVTHGYLPAQEELMAYVLSGFSAFPTTDQFVEGSGSQWAGQGNTYGGDNVYPDAGSWQGNGGMNEAAAGVQGSDSSYGNGRNEAYRDEQAHGQGMPHRDNTFGIAGPQAAQSSLSMPGRGDSVEQEGGGDAGSAGGRMQKVGDRWVFVRTAPA